MPTVDLASRELCAGVVLHSPLASGLRVIRPSTTCNLWCDPFPSIKKIGRVRSPVLFIHGEQDDIIPVSHSRQLMDRCSTTVDPLFLPTAGHNDVEFHEEYLTSLSSFLSTLSLMNPQTSMSTHATLTVAL